jgi:hypothetical protein
VKQSHVILCTSSGLLSIIHKDELGRNMERLSPDQFHYPDLRIFNALVFVILVEVIN